MADRVSQNNIQALGYTSPKARASQVNIQALGYTSPKARASQVNIQILWCPSTPQTLYCWARQTDDPSVYVVTPVLVYPP